MTDDTKENGKQVDSSVEKLELIRTLLDRAHAVVHCDARRAGVHLPAHLMGQSQVSLELSYEHDGALELTEELIEAALCFGEEYFECVVPLSAVWAVTDENNESKFWPEEMPKSVMIDICLLYTSPSPRDNRVSRMPSSA